MKNDKRYTENGIEWVLLRAQKSGVWMGPIEACEPLMGNINAPVAVLGAGSRRIWSWTRGAGECTQLAHSGAASQRIGPSAQNPVRIPVSDIAEIQYLTPQAFEWLQAQPEWTGQ